MANKITTQKAEKLYDEYLEYQKSAKKAAKMISKREKLKETLNREWYSLRSMLSFWWALFIFLLGGREAGKSYAVTKFFIG